MLRFRLFNVPVVVLPAFWIGSAILGSNRAQGPNAIVLLAIWVACAFASIMVHEFGHALTAAHFGAQPTIELHTLGGVMRRYGPALGRGKDFLITLAGPAAGLGLFAASYAVNGWSHLAASPYEYFSDSMTPRLALGTALAFLLRINLYWSLFNLLPILPLDGGHLLRNALGPRWLSFTLGIGVFFAGSLATLAILSGQWYLAIFLGYLTYANLRGDPRTLPGVTGR